MTLANLCGLFAIATVGAGLWILGSALLFHAPEIIDAIKNHVAVTIFWLCAFGFAVTFMTGIRT